MEEVLGARKTVVINLRRQEVFVSLTEVGVNAMLRGASKMHIKIDCVDLMEAVSAANILTAQNGHSARGFAALIRSAANQA